MPHDAHGVELKTGDTVLVRCKVTQIQAGTDYCNLSVETEIPMHPGTNKVAITLNTKQVERYQP